MFPRQSRNEAPLRLSGLAVVFLLLAAVGARGKRTVSGRKTADFPYASSRAPTPGRRTRWIPAAAPASWRTAYRRAGTSGSSAAMVRTGTSPSSLPANGIEHDAFPGSVVEPVHGPGHRPSDRRRARLAGARPRRCAADRRNPHLQPGRPARRLRHPARGRTGQRGLGSLAAGPRGAGRGRLRERCQAWRRPGHDHRDRPADDLPPRQPRPHRTAPAGCRRRHRADPAAEPQGQAPRPAEAPDRRGTVGHPQAAVHLRGPAAGAAQPGLWSLGVLQSLPDLVDGGWWC